MRKLKLDLDALQVDSFAVQSDVMRAGTVNGRIEGGTPIPYPVGDDSTGCDGGGWGSLFGSCDCPTVGTCIGPTYCCQPTWRPTCNPTCNWSCPADVCPP